MTNAPKPPRPYGWVIRGINGRGGSYSFRTTEPSWADIARTDEDRKSTAPHEPIPVMLYQPGLPSAAELAQLRADQARLDWLIQNECLVYATVNADGSTHGYCVRRDMCEPSLGDGDTAREAIDNARAK